MLSFNPTPSIERSGDVVVTVARAVPETVGSLGVPVGEKGAVPRQLGLDRATLVASGFDGKVGQTLVVPRRDGPSVVAVGVGDPATLDAARLRDAAAAFGRAAAKHAQLATTLSDVAAVDAEVAGQAIVEGILLARYRYGALKKETPGVGLTDITLVAAAGRSDGVGRRRHARARHRQRRPARPRPRQHAARSPHGQPHRRRGHRRGRGLRPGDRGLRRRGRSPRSAAGACSASTPAARSRRG